MCVCVWKKKSSRRRRYYIYIYICICETINHRRVDVFYLFYFFVLIYFISYLFFYLFFFSAGKSLADVTARSDSARLFTAPSGKIAKSRSGITCELKGACADDDIAAGFTDFVRRVERGRGKKTEPKPRTSKNTT